MLSNLPVSLAILLVKIDKMLTIQKSQTIEYLIGGCKKQQAKAQRALYDRFSPKMLGVCIRYIGETQEAEHVMIGGFVKVFTKIHQYSGEGNFEGWIRKIMVNEALMYVRKNQAMSLTVEVRDAESTIDFEALEDTLHVQDLIKLIQSLPIGYKTVFNLYAIEGYSHSEIAEKLNISESTSKSQLSRARKLLRFNLSRLEQQETKRKSGHGE